MRDLIAFASNKKVPPMSMMACVEWLNPQLRITGKRFSIIGLAFVLTLVTLVTLSIAIVGFNPATGLFAGSVALLCTLVFIPVLLITTAQRFRDTDRSGYLTFWWFPVFLVSALVGPVYFFFFIGLCLMPGTDGPNRFGSR